MASAFSKDVLRSISHSLGRFIAIAAIVALGTGFYAGLRMTSPDMDLSADRYYDGTQLMDIRVVSTMGLTDEDMQALRDLPDVSNVMPSYQTDVMANIAGELYAVRVHSLPDDAKDAVQVDNAIVQSDDNEYLNRLELAEGRWPEAPGECVISVDRVMNSPTQVGDSVTVTEGAQALEDILDVLEYTIVGYVHSPYYVSSSSMGTTTLGSGTIQQYMYILQEDFNPDLPYTDAFITVDDASGLMSSSDEYQQRIDRVIDEIEAIAPEREEWRIQQLRGDAQKELDDAWADYRTERSDAEAELSDAWAQLQDAAATIADSERQIANGQMEYDDGVAELNSQRRQAQQKFAEAEQQIASQQAQLDNGRQQLADAQAALAAGWSTAGITPDQADGLIAQLQQGLDQAEVGRSQAAEGRDQLQSGLAQYQAGLDQVDTGLSQAQAGMDEARQMLAGLQAQQAANPDDPTIGPQIAAVEAQIDQIQTTLDSLEAQRADIEAQMQPLQAQLDQVEGTIASLDGQIAELQSQMAGLQELQAQQTQFDQQQASFAQMEPSALQQLDQARSQLEQGRQQAEHEFADGERRLASAARELRNGRSELADGRQEYADGLTEYQDARAEADQKFADAESDLAKAQQDIDDLEQPEWLVMSREQNNGVVSFHSDAERISNIAQVFPFIFFLVAALVALTTMTRMVEEERILIGTYKALGYSRARIASKYMIYAAIASTAGSVVGILALSQVLPMTIMEAYSIIYSVPRGALPVDGPIALTAAGLGIGVTLFATWAAAFTTLREQPAALMLPRAPKAGKRILLERIRPLWRRLSFSWKVTFRNLFRYKKRLIMTVIGIAGCTALLLTGLGLQNSINDIIDKQYGQILQYNVVISVDEDLSPEAAETLNGTIRGDDRLSETTRTMNTSMVVENEVGEEYVASMVVPEDPESYTQLHQLRNRLTQEALAIGDDGVLITEKLSNALGLGVGDTVILAEQDQMGNATDVTYTVPVSGVVENYVANYVLIGSAYYQQTFHEIPTYATYYAKIDEASDVRDAFSEEFRQIDGVKTVAYNDEVISTYRTMLNSVNMVVVVLVIAAAALAFIVLYNLTNINITERQREIATLKVLGFTPREVDLYIYREILLLSILGALLGLVLGIYLEGFVVVTAEVDYVMFGRDIHWDSFVLAFLLTLAFTVLVLLFMRRKLANVDMIESLKSNE